MSEEPGPPDATQDALVFTASLEGFEGPLDLLLALVRTAEIDLGRLSVAALASQYLAFLKTVPPDQLGRAAEYLVMAAWLAMLKSRLLLPEDAQPDEEETPQMMAERLAQQMKTLAAMQSVAVALAARPQLGRSFFVSGQQEGLLCTEKIEYRANVSGLYRVLSALLERQQSRRARLQMGQLPVLDAEVARRHLTRLLDRIADWTPLESVLPDIHDSPTTITPDNQTIFYRSSLASSLMAALEMQREGVAELRQQTLSAPIQIRAMDRG